MKKTFLIAATLLIGFAANAETTNTETTSETMVTSSIVPETTEATELATDGFKYNESRFSTITEVGSTFAYHKAYFNVYQVLGIRVNPYFFIGQGLGVQVSNNKIYQFQATIDMRAYALDKKITPMFTLQAGLNKVGNAPYDNYESPKKLGNTQFILNAGTGILIYAKPNASFTINGGYTLFTDFKNNANGGFVKVGYVF
ncbi:MAG: hypothetical protein RJA25_750 [Bacteroidota bacterium]|mgnify:FL=1|jgi:hypothetical protein